MGCTGLRSILGKLCDSFHCSFGTFLDCSSNQVVVVTGADDSLNDLDLPDILNAMKRNPKNLKEKNVSEKKVEKAKDGEKQKLLGIAKVAEKCIAKLGSRFTDEEKNARYEAASQLSEQESLQERFKKKKPLYLAEARQVDRQAEEVRLYGSTAAALWRTCRSYQWTTPEDFQKWYQVGGINEAQLRILSRLNPGCFETNASYFKEVSFGIRQIFLEAAKKGHRKALERFVPWTCSLEVQPSQELVYPERINEILNTLSKTEDANAKHSLRFKKLRLNLLLRILGIHTPVSELTPVEIKKINEGISKLQKADGAMVSLFHEFKKKVEPGLSRKGGALREVQPELRGVFLEDPGILENLKKANLMVDLDLISLLSLYQAAIHMPQISFSQKQSAYCLGDWLVELNFEKENTDGL